MVCKQHTSQNKKAREKFEHTTIGGGGGSGEKRICDIIIKSARKIVRGKKARKSMYTYGRTLAMARCVQETGCKKSNENECEREREGEKKKDVAHLANKNDVGVPVTRFNETLFSVVSRPISLTSLSPRHQLSLHCTFRLCVVATTSCRCCCFYFFTVHSHFTLIPLLAYLESGIMPRMFLDAFVGAWRFRFSGIAPWWFSQRKKTLCIYKMQREKKCVRTFCRSLCVCVCMCECILCISRCNFPLKRTRLLPFVLFVSDTIFLFAHLNYIPCRLDVLNVLFTALTTEFVFSSLYFLHFCLLHLR